MKTKRIYSSDNFIKTPKIRPPRLDLRNRTKRKTDIKKPKEKTLKKKTDNSLVSAIEMETDDILNNRVRREPFKDLSSLVKKPISKKVKIEFKGKDWVFTQVSALSTVNIEDDGFTITEDTAKYVNNNGNSWETDDIKKCFKTMVGASNLKDHIDTDEGGIIYGVIVDAVLRKIKTSDEKGFIYYVDVIIATNKNIDPDWASSIQRGIVKYVSVGFSCDFLMCSKCGHIYKIDGKGICPHCLFQLGMKYVSKYGYSRISARASDGLVGGKMVFDEISYLSVNPAFEGAIQSYNMNVAENQSVIIEFPKSAIKRPALKKFIKEKQVRIVE